MKALRTVILLAFAVLALCSVAVIVYYWPAIDRVANICAYYPNLVIDCKE